MLKRALFASVCLAIGSFAYEALWGGDWERGLDRSIASTLAILIFVLVYRREWRT